MKQTRVFQLISSERLYQDDKWGKRHDGSHSWFEWLAIADCELAEAKGALLSGDEVAARAEVLQAAAVLVAAMEAKGVSVEPSHAGRICELKGYVPEANESATNL